MDNEPIKAKRRKPFKWLVRLAVVMVLYTVTGFFIAPAVIKSQMLKRLPALTKRSVAVEQVKCNPYALSLTIRGFSLKEPGGEVFASFDEVYVNFQLSSIFRRKFVFDEISVKSPFAQVTYREDGTFNFANLLTNAAPATKPKGPPQQLPAVLIYSLNVTNGGVAFADLTRKPSFRTQFLPINVNLTNLTTVKDQDSPYRIMARDGAGEVFAWAGTVTVNPLRSAGAFRLGGLKLGNYAPYAQDYARFQIADGTVDLTADYRYDSVTNMLDLTVSNAVVFLTKLELKASDTGETVLSIPTLSVRQAEASLAGRTARVREIKSSGGSILARQNQDGTINLLSQLILPPKDATANSKPAATAAAPFSAKIDEIAFDNYTIKVEDKKPAKPASFNLDQLGFTLKGVSNLSNAPVTASLTLRFQETGTIGVEGSATLLPPSADIRVAVSNLDLRALQPYVSEQVKLVVNSGSVAVNGRAVYPGPAAGADAPLLSFAGDVAVNKFATTDDVLFKDFVKWDALSVDGINLTLQPDKLKVEQVKFTGLDTSVIIGPDKRPVALAILRKDAAASNAPPVTATDANAPAVLRKIPDVSLGALVLAAASIHFSDQSIEPHCSFDVQEFGGTIQGLSSQNQTTATVDLHGKVDARSPFSVTGKVNPLAQDLFADIGVTFTNMELTAFTPYTEKFAGRPLEKGKLSFGVHYLVDHKNLKAENGFYVDQLTLGAKNNSPDATSLPVKLGIALLKDRNGRINLDVPLAGRIDDPKFRLMPIIWQVVVNLLEKAATSPFSLLGSMFGGGEELSFVDFQPGVATLGPGETNKLETLAKALYERPTVSLEISGFTDPAPDGAALAQAKFTGEIKGLWLKEQLDAGVPVANQAETNPPPADYERLVRKRYFETVGTNVAGADLTNTNAAAGTNSAPVQAAVPKATNTPPATADAQTERPAKPIFAMHGATLLLRRVENTAPIKAAPVAVPAAVVAAAPSVQPAVAEPVAPEIDLATMEAELVKRIVVTDDDLRDLMQARANQVQSYLLQSGKVTAERVFVTAPRPVSAASKGEQRAKMTLE